MSCLVRVPWFPWGPWATADGPQQIGTGSVRPLQGLESEQLKSPCSRCTSLRHRGCLSRVVQPRWLKTIGVVLQVLLVNQRTSGWSWGPQNRLSPSSRVGGQEARGRRCPAAWVRVSADRGSARPLVAPRRLLAVSPPQSLPRPGSC